MRDGEHGAPARPRPQRALHLQLRMAVERARRLVQQQHGSIAQQGTGDRQALALSAREPDAAFAHDGVIPLRQLPNEGVAPAFPASACCSALQVPQKVW